MDSESSCIRGCLSRGRGRGRHTGAEQLSRAGRHLQWVRGRRFGETGVGEGYKRVERYIKAPFLSLGSSQAGEEGPLLSQALPSATSQRRSAPEGPL